MAALPDILRRLQKCLRLSILVVDKIFVRDGDNATEFVDRNRDEIG